MSNQQANAFIRQYLGMSAGMYPPAIEVSGTVYAKEQTVGTPRYVSADRTRVIPGADAIRMIGEREAQPLESATIGEVVPV